jgi:CheY-like chemotaxis protein
VLVVEDEPDVRVLFAEMLTDAGYRVAAAESALGLLTAVRRLHPAAVVLDLGLPYASGARLLSELRADADPAVRAVPVVVVSAYTEALPSGRRAQVSAVLRKPVGLDELVGAVRAAAGGPPDAGGGGAVDGPTG